MASENITFYEIPGSVRKPGKYIEFNTRLAVRTLPQNPQRVCIIAQRLTTGTVAEAVPTKVFSDDEARVYFGVGSLAHRMVRAAIKANPYLQLTVVALDDAAAGQKAAGTLTFTGPANSSGVFNLYIGNDEVDIAIASTDTATAIAAALVAEIAKHPDLPITAAVGEAPNPHVVTITAKHKGLCGNDIGLGYDCTAANVGVAVVAMTAGVTNPDPQDALDAIVAEQYEIIVTPYNDQTDLVTLRDHLDLVSGPLEQRPSIAVYAMTGAIAAATTLAGQVNHGRVNGPALRCTTTKRKSPPYEIAAAYAAMIAYEEDPARPLNTLELKGIAVPNIADRFSRTEQESLLYNGVAPLEIGPGGRVQIVRAISTYVLDPQGVPDISLLDITTIRTLDYVRKACRERIALRFPRDKLSSKTPDRVKAELYDVLKMLEDLEIVEAVDDNKDGLIVERDEQDPNRLDAKIPCDVVNGLHVFAARIDLIL